MQQPSDPADAQALATALAAGTRRFSHLLEVDWVRDGLYSHALSDLSEAVGSAGVDRGLEDSTPGSEVIASGAASGQLTVTLSGSLPVDGQLVPVAEVLAPYNTASPLYGVKVVGAPVRWSIVTATDRGPISTRQFTGWVDSRRVDRAANRVRLTCLDKDERLDDPAFWPVWGVNARAAARAGGTAQQRAIASAVVDVAANAAGLRTRPRPAWETDSRASAVLHLPLAGALAPTVGRMFSQQFVPGGTPEPRETISGQAMTEPYWIDGPFGSAARNAMANRYPGKFTYAPGDVPLAYSGYSTSLTAWIYCGPGAPGYNPDPAAARLPAVADAYFGYMTQVGNAYPVRASIGCDGARVQAQMEVGTDVVYLVTHTPSTDAWRHVHLQSDHSGTQRVVMFVDGVAVADFAPTGTTNAYPNEAISVLLTPAPLTVRPGARMADVTCYRETGDPVVVPERTVTQAAVIDRSLNELTHLPRPRGSWWDVLRDTAAAEYATLLVDEQGMLQWRNRDTVRSAADPLFTVTVDEASDVGVVDTAVGLANAAQIGATPAQAAWATAFDTDSPDTINAPPGKSSYVFPTDGNVAAPDTGTAPRMYQSNEATTTPPAWSDKVISGWVFTYADNTEETSNSSLVSTVDQTGLGDRQLIRISVDNRGVKSGKFHLKSDSAAGSDARPSLRIGGLVLTEQPTESATIALEENIAADGERNTLALDSDDWRQHLPSVEASARFALRRASQAIPTFDRVTTPGDPRRQVTDPCVLRLGASGPRVRTYVAAITRTLDTKLTDVLTVRATHAPNRWVLGDPELGALESTAVLG